MVLPVNTGGRMASGASIPARSALPAAKTTLLLAVLPLAWLLPNHDLPWLSAWQDGLALLALGLAAVVGGRWQGLPRPAALFVLLALACVAAQAATGLLVFSGDAWMVALYLLGFTLALALGRAWTWDAQAAHPAQAGLDRLHVAVVGAALVTVGLALAQWTQTGGSWWLVDLAPHGRPFGNVAQPNHLCSIAFVGLCTTLLLHQRRRLQHLSAGLLAWWFMLGMVLPGSRTGWLQMALLVGALALARRGAAGRAGQADAPAGLRLPAGAAWVLGAGFAALTAAWPQIADALQLAARRTSSTESGGLRLQHGQMLLDAVSQQPWLGWGWLQTGRAQLLVADRHPFVGEQLDHAHNLVLDLLLWCGLPLGTVLTGVLVFWFASRWHHCLRSLRGWGAVPANPGGSEAQPAQAFWLLLAASGLVVHSLLEFPLEYAYFLLPLGLWLGAVDSLQGRPVAALAPAAPWPQAAQRVARRALALLLLGLLLVVGRDYLRAEAALRTLRLESAHIGVTGLQTPPPELALLTQLQAFQHFVHTEARPGMAAAELVLLRHVAERYPMPPALFRHALAQGLNGDPAGAALTLQRLCRIHSAARCAEMRLAWPALRLRQPVLQAVAVPAAPPASPAPDPR